MSVSRVITDHVINDFNRENVTVTAEDGPGPGGASHHYVVSVNDVGVPDLHIHFQNGPVKEAGVNGVTDEALLAILIDRLRGFQRGPYSCRHNALALTKEEEALHWLSDRTKERQRRGVEGTNQV